MTMTEKMMNTVVPSTNNLKIRKWNQNWYHRNHMSDSGNHRNDRD